MKKSVRVIGCAYLAMIFGSCLSAQRIVDGGAREDRPYRATNGGRVTKKAKRGPGGQIASGAGNVAGGAAKAAGSLAVGTAEAAVSLATLHPVAAGTALGGGAVAAGTNLAVGTVKGAGKITWGLGRAVAKIL